MLTINTLPNFKYFVIKGLHETRVVCLPGNCQQLCLPCRCTLYPSQLLYPYSLVAATDLLPHSVTFEPDFFRLPLKAFTSCTVNAQSPSTFFMSSTTSVDLSADLITMNGQQSQGRGLSPTISALASLSGTERPFHERIALGEISRGCIPKSRQSFHPRRYFRMGLIRI